jgi:hypothetical protein
MKVLDLFAGTRSISKAFIECGHETFSIELDKRHEHIDWYANIMDVTPEDIIERFGYPDVIWASPPCTSYSIAGISHHRRKNMETGELEPFSKFAFLSDELVKHVLYLIDSLIPTYYFIENPRGGLRTMKFMEHLPRYTTAYCQYGDNRQKPTDIWSNHPSPNFSPVCKLGSPCHESSPSGSKRGTQGMKSVVDKSRIPHDLCLHIASICEEGLNGKAEQRTVILSQVKA